MLEPLWQRFQARDRLALTRLLSFAARGEHLPEIRQALGPSQRSSRVVAITGSAGVGKSTLVGKLIDHIRAQDQSVAVLACDPQSPLTGGALLGDRFRMSSRSDDDDVFIRSLAAVGGQGAVAQHVDVMLRALEAFGFDAIILETVGAGQGDTTVRELADVVVLLLQPETGDDLQWEKAGVLEIADVVVVHKADMPGADRVEAQVRATLDLSGTRAVSIIRVSAKTGEGIDKLWSAIGECPLRRHPAERDERMLLRLVQEEMASRFSARLLANDPELRQITNRWKTRQISDDQTFQSILELLGRHSAHSSSS